MAHYGPNEAPPLGPRSIKVVHSKVTTRLRHAMRCTRSLLGADLDAKYFAK
jgi:hypothetical protein